MWPPSTRNASHLPVPVLLESRLRGRAGSSHHAPQACDYHLPVRRLPLLLFLTVVASSLTAESFRARVTKVYDGDTIVVRDSRGNAVTVRLEGIDAPERYQPYSSQSRESLRKLVLHRVVTVVPRDVDQYDRVVGVVVEGTTDVALEQVKRGLAWHYRQFEERQEYGNRIAYSRAERDARTGRIGLWSRPDPVPPWRYRWRR
jgi:endonuclease YncB( thermonuclease family)